MRSCWLINFKNGNKLIISEKEYESYQRLFQTRASFRDKVISEEHWFSVEACINKNTQTYVAIEEQSLT